MPLERKPFSPKRLSLVARAEDFQDDREPPLRIGDRVQLNSGSPVALVVDTDIDTVTLAWGKDIQIDETVFPRVCIHRMR
jgi:hypothetical protein